jgi:hypothetical protein
VRPFALPLRLPSFDLAMSWRAEADAGMTWLGEQPRAGNFGD